MVIDLFGELVEKQRWLWVLGQGLLSVEDKRMAPTAGAISVEGKEEFFGAWHLVWIRFGEWSSLLAMLGDGSLAFALLNAFFVSPLLVLLSGAIGGKLFDALRWVFATVVA